MGKSDRKIRADSINNLRKRYDAFLEEDRKRKERNEDILAKLDKMRSSVSRYKANIYLDQRLPMNIFGDTQKSPVRTHKEPEMSTELDIRRPHVDETLLLSQISKKYILIPKLRSTDTNDYIPRALQQDNNNDNDWKSKYSILDKLKQNEKEETINTSAFDDKNIKNYENISTGLPKYQDDEPVKLSAKHDNDNTEGMKKDLAVNEFTSTIPTHARNIADEEKFDDYSVDFPKDILKEPEKQPLIKSAVPNAREHSAHKSVTKSNEFVDNNFSDGMNGKQQPKNEVSFVVSEAPVQNYLAADTPEKSQSLESVSYIADQPNYSAETIDKHETENTEKSSLGDEYISHGAPLHPEQPYYDTTEMSQATARQPESSYPGDDDITHVEVLHPDELVHEISDDVANTGASQEAEYPIDIINVEEFTPGSDVNLVDGVNINPEGHDIQQYNIPPSHQYAPETVVVAEQEKEGIYQDPVYTDEQVTNEGDYDTQQYESTVNVDNLDITSGIQEFETEQNEMYYSEQSNVQYDQYNQGDVADAYNAGYNQAEAYDPSAYYDGAQQEGAYPVEISEHEETSQRYDPNYEQQYANPGEQNQYAEQPQGHQEILDVTGPPGEAEVLEYDRGQYDAEPQQTADHVEQQLDLEDGYIEGDLAGNIRAAAEEAVLNQQESPVQKLEQSS